MEKKRNACGYVITVFNDEGGVLLKKSSLGSGGDTVMSGAGTIEGR